MNQSIEGKTFKQVRGGLAALQKMIGAMKITDAFNLIEAQKMASLLGRTVNFNPETGEFIYVGALICPFFWNGINREKIVNKNHAPKILEQQFTTIPKNLRRHFTSKTAVRSLVIIKNPMFFYHLLSLIVRNFF